MAFVDRVRRVDVEKAVVGLKVEVGDIVISEVDREIFSVFVDVDVLKVVAGIFDKIVDV